MDPARKVGPVRLTGYAIDVSALSPEALARLAAGSVIEDTDPAFAELRAAIIKDPSSC